MDKELIWVVTGAGANGVFVIFAYTKRESARRAVTRLKKRAKQVSDTRTFYQMDSAVLHRV